MCLIVVAIRTSKHPLVIAANRDESHARPTLAAFFWPDAPSILGGRDALHRGSWLAVTRSGRFAAVTNLRGSGAGQRSRGELVTAFLSSEIEPVDYLGEVAGKMDQYGGFHLLAGMRSEAALLCGSAKRLGPGVHALSNAPAGIRWPKVEVAEKKLSRLSEIEDPGDLVAATLEFLSTSHHSGKPEKEIFLKGEQYGTRSSTVVVITAANRLYFAEQGYGPGGNRDGNVRRFSFTLTGA